MDGGCGRARGHRRLRGTNLQSWSVVGRGAVLCAGPDGGPWDSSAVKGLEKDGFEHWFCVTLFEERGLRECDEQRYFWFYSILAPFIARTLLVCLFS